MKYKCQFCSLEKCSAVLFFFLELQALIVFLAVIVILGCIVYDYVHDYVNVEKTSKKRNLTFQKALFNSYFQVSLSTLCHLVQTPRSNGESQLNRRMLLKGGM